MEVVEVATTKRQPRLPCPPPAECPCNVKCSRRYVQPSRTASFAPVRSYHPPSHVLEANTTYHMSYLNVDQAEMRRSRSQPIRPRPTLAKSDGRFSDETTNKLSYKSVGCAVRAKPIVPKHRSMIGTGPMDTVTTVRQDYSRKHVDKPDIVLPCGNIRLSSGKLEGTTTAKLSYADPGPTEPTCNFKPIQVYRPPSDPLPRDTTQKLSYQPVRIEEKDECPWRLKPIYKPPDVAMCAKTTYSESFLKNEESCTEKPVRPVAGDVLPRGGEFHGKTIYKESYLQSADLERVEPVIPCNSISKAEGKISADTTTKMSFQPVQSEKRSPILPRSRSMIGDGPMQSETTSRSAFVPKSTTRPDLIVPCNNLRNPEAPIDDRTTTRMSYATPGPVQWVQSFKPVATYRRLPEKIEADTVNKLSYQAWTPFPKETLPWASKGKYQPPTDPMCADTIYQVSYPAPGHYEEICPSEECDCLHPPRACPPSHTETANDAICDAPPNQQIPV